MRSRSPAELPLAFAEHATSKLTCDDDLFRIGTMGFRGEALASIGAVSQARILSRTAESEAAYEIHNREGMISDAQAAAGNMGTMVEVRNLFSNTPARRKFLKGTSTAQEKGSGPFLPPHFISTFHEKRQSEMASVTFPVLRLIRRTQRDAQGK